MRTLAFLFISVLVGTISIAQPPQFQEVVEVEGATAPELYARAKEWFADSFVSAQNVIELDDAQNFRVIGKGNSGKYIAMPKSGLIAEMKAYASFTVKIECREGRYRYEFSDIYENNSVKKESLQNLYDYSNVQNLEKRRDKEGLPKVKKKRLENIAKKNKPRYDALNNLINSLSNSLKEYMKKAKTQDDW